MTAVTIHYAQSLDGRLATRSGDSQWLGGPRSLELAHQLRAQHEAILVGVGTVLADNPRLTVRLVPGRSPTRIVVDSTLRLPLDAHVLTDGATRTIVATTSRAGADRVRAVGFRPPAGAALSGPNPSAGSAQAGLRAPTRDRRTIRSPTAFRIQAAGSAFKSSCPTQVP